MGLVKGIFTVLGFLVLVLVGLAAYLWFTDYEVEATISDKGRDAGGDYVVVTPRLIPYDVKHVIDAEEATFVCEGYQVKYRVQTQRVRVFDDRDVLVYDSDSGLQNEGSLLRCGASNAGGGILGLGAA